MEAHGGTQVDETGLEGRTWQLGLGAGPGPYPNRPGEPDCSYYLRTGSCGFGNRCRFNHPRDRSVASDALQASGGEYQECISQAVCQHYVRTGTCKFGASCKYHHPRAGPAPVAFNFHGYPLRPGEEECTYYLKTGRCKYGASCKFHHPQPAGAEFPPPPPVLLPPPPSQQYGNFIQIPRPTVLSSSYIPGNYGPMIVPRGIVTVPSWTPYRIYANNQPTVSPGPAYGLTSSTTSHAAHEYPQRPGEGECQYYLRTGDCKFGSTCKYHHPPEAKTGLMLGPMGLPLRPGAPICFHYARNGVCRFGPSCRFNHPMRTISYSSSTSSLAGMPVAPSSSSSNLRLEPHKADDVPSPSKNTTMSSVRQDSNASSSHGV